tara:strand:- start:45 stop:608 length:564 start_codon:yes stop_codon:yes gene_type:complete
MNVTDAILEFNNIFSKDLCKKLIEYIDHRAKNKLHTHGKTDKRQVFGQSLDDRNISDKIYFKLIQREITKIYPLYKAKFPFLVTSKISQIDILKYPVNHHYGVHTDHSAFTQRTLSIIINLNEEYEGGDLVFYNPSSFDKPDMSKDEVKRIKLKMGGIVFFPSIYLYPHSIQPITKGVRYSLVSWLI